MFYVYILYSPTLNKHYTGYSIDSEERLKEHNAGHYEGSYSSRVSDWQLKLRMSCQSKTQAIKVEAHIKRMKSRRYIENLIKYPEMREKLLLKYS